MLSYFSKRVFFINFFLILFLCSCSKEIATSDEKFADISLYNTHYILSEADQEPIIIDAKSFEMYLQSQELVMTDVKFRQNKKGLKEPNLEGYCAYLTVNTKTQDAYLEGNIEISIYPDKNEEEQSTVQKQNQQILQTQVLQDNMQNQEEKSIEAESQQEIDNNLILDNVSMEKSQENDQDSNNDYKDNNEPTSEGRPLVNKIYAESLKWGKYTSLIESPGYVKLMWEDVVLEGTGFKGNINSGDFSFESIINGSL